MLRISLFVIVIDTRYRNYTIGTFWTLTIVQRSKPRLFL